MTEFTVLCNDGIVEGAEGAIAALAAAEARIEALEAARNGFGWCIVCGVNAGEPCRSLRTGSRRERPHFYRAPAPPVPERED